MSSSNFPKILYIMPQLGEGGGERVVTTLIRNIFGGSNDNYLYLLLPNGNNDYADLLSSDVDVRIRKSTKRIRYSFLSVLFNIRKIIKEEGIDIVFLGSGTLNAYLSFFRFMFPKKVKFVARETNLVSIYESSKLARLFYKYTYSTFDIIIAQSDEMVANLVHSGVKLEKIYKINNPVDMVFLQSESEQEPEFEFNDKSKLNVVCLGRFTYQKGFDLLLESINDSGVSDVDFYFFGGGEDKEVYEEFKRVNALDNVYIEPFLSNPYPVIKAADLLISPSRWEGYPNVVIEAIALGTPVLANIYPGGIKEISDNYNCTVSDLSLELEDKIYKAISCKPKVKEFIYDNKKILESYEKLLSNKAINS